MENNRKREVILKKWSRKKPANGLVYRLFGGELGIRTLGTFLYTTFRVSHLRPLGQLSTSIFQSVFPTNKNSFKKLLGRKTGKKTKKYSIFKFVNPNKIKVFLRTKLPNGLKFSSQSRYDHFDTTPYMLNSRRSVTDYLIFSVNGTSPVMSCCGIPKKSSHPLALDFIRPRPLLFARFFCHRQRSQTSPLRYHTV